MPGHLTDAFRSLRERREEEAAASSPGGVSAQGATLDLSGWVVPGSTGVNFDFSGFTPGPGNLYTYPPVDELPLTVAADTFSVPDGLYMVNLTSEPDVAPSVSLMVSLIGSDVLATSLVNQFVVDPVNGPVSKLCWLVASEPISVYAVNQSSEDLTFLALTLDLFKIG